jgi:hypothetical protein
MTRQERIARFDQQTCWEPHWNYAQATGNPWFEQDGYRCTVYPNQKHGGWSYVINDPQDRPSWPSIRYDDQDQAMMAAVKAFEKGARV